MSIITSLMISIIIPAHNEYQNLVQRLPYLDQLVSNSHINAEVLVMISRNTSDATPDIPVGKNIRLYQSTRNGRAVQMNEGTCLASGDVLVFLHADVIPPPEFLEDIHSCIQNGTEAGFFSYQFDTDNYLLRINAYFTGKDGIFTGGGDQCLFISRKRFESLGKFDPQQVIMEDFEFFRRMKKAGVHYKIIRNDLIVSSRKYKSNSYLRVNLSNLVLLVLFHLGWSSEKLRNLHDKFLNLSYAQEGQEGTAPRA